MQHDIEARKDAVFHVQSLRPSGDKLQRCEIERRMLEALPPVERPTPTVAERLTLPALLLLAWIIFELTANATLSLLAACVRFGWDDFRTAAWLRRTDPDRARGRACGWFYVCSGVWKTALMPIGLIMIMSIVWAVIAPAAVPADGMIFAQLTSAIVVGLAAAALLVLTVFLAVALSLAADVRVWVHHDLHASRRVRIWPPRWTTQVWQHDNRGRAILATALIFTTIGLPPLVFPAIVRLGAGMETIAALALVFGLPMAATTAFAGLRGRLFARHPIECWPESLVEIGLPDEHDSVDEYAD